MAAAVVTDPKTTGTEFDTLEVMVSRDCGATYTSLYKKAGKDLITRSETVSTPLNQLQMNGEKIR